MLDLVQNIQFLLSKAGIPCAQLFNQLWHNIFQQLSSLLRSKNNIFAPISSMLNGSQVSFIIASCQEWELIYCGCRTKCYHNNRSGRIFGIILSAMSERRHAAAVLAHPWPLESSSRTATLTDLFSLY